MLERIGVTNNSFISIQCMLTIDGMLYSYVYSVQFVCIKYISNEFIWMTFDLKIEEVGKEAPTLKKP